MGKRFTGAEIEQIKTHVSEGLTNREIAQKLSRTEPAVRNIRYREDIKASTKNQLPLLIRDRDRLTQEIAQLTQRKNLLSENISGLQVRRGDLSKALQFDESALQARLSKALPELKQKRPELFYISGEEQLAKITENILSALFRYLIP